VRRFGLPQALYVDRDSIYKTTREPSVEEQLAAEQPLTQFGRAMQELAVELVLAYSPQAKGRVERRNGVLQDRLVKEMRLEGIKDLEAANEFLEKKFLPQFNRKFCVVPAEKADVHRPVPRGLKEVLSWEEQRVVQRDWTVNCKERYYQLEAEHEGLCLAGKKVTVRELRDGEMQLLWQGQKLRVRQLSGRPLKQRESRKVVAREARPPTAEHPWRQFGVGVGGEYWRKEKARGRAARQAFRELRSASATLRPPCVPGMPAEKGKCAKPTKGTFSPELIRGHF
jgi:hypothetical protein